jgi:type II secretory pathway component GspD/PulD (secretin)
MQEQRTTTKSSAWKRLNSIQPFHANPLAMKTELLLLLVTAIVSTCPAAEPNPPRTELINSHPITPVTSQTFSSLDRPAAGQPMVPPAAINLDDKAIPQVFTVYQNISRRTLVPPARVPDRTITVRVEHALTPQQALQLLDTVLSQHGIVMIPQGTNVIKAVPVSAALTEAVPICELTPEELPESNSYTLYIVRVKHRVPRDLAIVLQPLAKMPNSIVASNKEGTIMLRDYAVNVRRMLQVIERLDKNPNGKDEQ